MPEFCHLHCHTQYSLLDGASEIGAMMDKAVKDGQKGVALTDHGNMFGAFKFVAEANKRGITPIVGCEFYLVKDRHKQSFSRAKGEKDVRYHQLMLAKNQVGYHNLVKLCSLGYIEGMYGKYPRIDKELVLQYNEGIIATSCCIGAEIPQLLLYKKYEEAERALKWWLDIFGENYYIEIQRHDGLEDIDGLGVSQEDINQHLLRLAKKYNVKVIATNDSHYVEEEDSASHDILLCVNTGNLLEETKRFKFPSSDFYFKTQAEMEQRFKDVPVSLDTTMEILNKIEPLQLARDVLLPAFPIPEGFETQDDFLRHMTFEGARKRYGTITPEIEERLNFELQTIKRTGYPGYFLIVQDFTNTAREIGVSVGPGRGSAAGSAVSYCIGITNVDPIKYDLLFERFLNPERVSMPDIDIDFDDEGRQKVIDYVVEKYGQNQVAQIITYGSMKAKSALRDVGRVMNIPLQEVDKVAKTFPDNLKASLGKVLAEGDVHPKLKSNLNSDELQKAHEFRKLAEGNQPIAQMIRAAKKLEGSVRNTGVHACGVVITPDDVTKYVPVSMAKDNELYISQFDNSVAEDAGLLKMDFLGLKTLTIIKDAVEMIKENHGVELDMDEVPLDDVKTYELFQRGETVGIFQYESAGMQKYMKELKPTAFNDLIAMNALYRPGPLEYIPNFINRKHGREEIVYDLDAMEEYLHETYGICVYQEQVMLLSQKLANFSKGEADVLRKAMGKKKKNVLDKMYPQFLEGGASNGHPKKVLDKVWKDWEAFASYAFNKSHSTCYALVAFQTAYLKANYPAEFMAGVLSHNMKDIKKLNFFLSECNRMGIKCMLPDVNESNVKFAVNKKGEIRFAMAAVKGVGAAAVEDLIAERKKGGTFRDIFDIVKRVNLRTVNKKAFENLALAGGFDSFGLHRAQYFYQHGSEEVNLIERILKFGNQYQKQGSTSQMSLFGAAVLDQEVATPKVYECEEWGLMERLKREREVTGIFLSGHPLDDYKMEVDFFCNATLDDITKRPNKDLTIGCIVMSVEHRITKNGNGFGKFLVEDFNNSYEIVLFGDDYITFKGYLEEGLAIQMKGMYKNRGWGNNDRYEFRLSKVRLLSTILEEEAKKITVTIPLDIIDTTFITRMQNLCHQHPGKMSLAMNVIDRKNGYGKIELFSKSLKLEAKKEVFEKLKSFGEMRLKLN